MNSQEARETTRNRKQQLAKKAQQGAMQSPTDSSASIELLFKSDQFSTMIRDVLPNIFTPQRMVKLLLTAVRTNRDLALCQQSSVMACVMTLAALGLEPNTPLGHAYLIPRNGREKRGNEWYDVKNCTLVIGYQGFIELAMRSGLVDSVRAHAVLEGDDFDYELGSKPVIHHKPRRVVGEQVDPETGEVIPRQLTHAYAVCDLANGKQVFEVLPKEDIDARRARSPSKNNGPWVSDYVAMGKKSAVRALWKWMPKTPAVSLAVSADAAAEDGEPPAMSPEVRAKTQALMQPAPGASFFGPEVPRYEPADFGYTDPGRDLSVPHGPASTPAAAASDAREAEKGARWAALRKKWGHWLDDMAKARDCSLEEAATLLAQGWEIDPNTKEAVPPAGGQDDG